MNYQPGWQELLSVYDPSLSQTQVFDPNPPGASGGFGFLYSQNLTMVHQGQWASRCIRVNGPMEGLGPWDPFGGGSSGRPKADIMEAEGRLNGGLGAKPQGNWGPWALLGALAAIPIGGVIGIS